MPEDPAVVFDSAARVLYFNGHGFSEEFLTVFGQGWSERVPEESFVQVVKIKSGSEKDIVALKIPLASELFRAAVRIQWRYIKRSFNRWLIRRRKFFTWAC